MRLKTTITLHVPKNSRNWGKTKPPIQRTAILSTCNPLYVPIEEQEELHGNAGLIAACWVTFEGKNEANCRSRNKCSVTSVTSDS